MCIRDSFIANDSEFQINYNAGLFKDLAFVKSNVTEKQVQMVDARPNGRFRGVEPEPRPDVPSGRIPDSLNVPFFTNFNMEEKVLRSPEDVKANMVKANVDLGKPIVMTCGSGMTACNLAFALFLATGTKYPVFDGSWFDWQIGTPNTPEWQVRDQ